MKRKRRLVHTAIAEKVILYYYLTPPDPIEECIDDPALRKQIQARLKRGDEWAWVGIELDVWLADGRRIFRVIVKGSGSWSGLSDYLADECHAQAREEACYALEEVLLAAMGRQLRGLEKREEKIHQRYDRLQQAVQHLRRQSRPRRFVGTMTA